MSDERDHHLRVLAAARAALKRHDKENHPDPDITRGFATAGETLMWIDILDEAFRDHEQYVERRANCMFGKVVPGLVFVRNEIIHQRVLTLAPYRSEGLTFPITFPMRFEGTWFRWSTGLKLTKIRHRWSKPQFDSYRQCLANRYTQDTLRYGVTWCEKELGLPPNEWAINSA